MLRNKLDLGPLRKVGVAWISGLAVGGSNSAEDSPDGVEAGREGLAGMLQALSSKSRQIFLLVVADHSLPGTRLETGLRLSDLRYNLQCRVNMTREFNVIIERDEEGTYVPGSSGARKQAP